MITINWSDFIPWRWEYLADFLNTNDPRFSLRSSLNSYIDPVFSSELTDLIREFGRNLPFYKLKPKKNSLLVIAGAYPFICDMIDVECENVEGIIDEHRELACKLISDLDDHTQRVSKIDKLWQGVGQLVLKAKRENDIRLHEFGKIYEILKLQRELAILERDANDKTLEDEQTKWSFGTH